MAESSGDELDAAWSSPMRWGGAMCRRHAEEDSGTEVRTGSSCCDTSTSLMTAIDAKVLLLEVGARLPRRPVPCHQRCALTAGSRVLNRVRMRGPGCGLERDMRIRRGAKLEIALAISIVCFISQNGVASDTLADANVVQRNTH
jgi:hypothetical protein